jgi:rhodanese-related sulfurtransferase
MVTLVGCASTGKGGGSAVENEMELGEATPQEARRLLADGYIYLDVRTPEEFQAGRPAGSVNIPVMLIDPASGEKELNPRFLDAVTTAIPKEQRVILGCRTGQRSAFAQRMMYERGYRHTLNMIGGYAGIADAGGRVVQEGWSTLNYPIEKD